MALKKKNDRKSILVSRIGTAILNLFVFVLYVTILRILCLYVVNYVVVLFFYFFFATYASVREYFYLLRIITCITMWEFRYKWPREMDNLIHFFHRKKLTNR